MYHTHTHIRLYIKLRWYLILLRWEKQMNIERVYLSSWLTREKAQRNRLSSSYQWTTESCFNLNITTAHARPFKTENFPPLFTLFHRHTIIWFWFIFWERKQCVCTWNQSNWKCKVQHNRLQPMTRVYFQTYMFFHLWRKGAEIWEFSHMLCYWEIW